MKTGELIDAGRAKLGGYFEYRWWKCSRCGTQYPEILGEIRCNSHTIEKCPWCKPDSAPWKDGRGI